MILAETFVYDESVMASCAACDCKVWLGPKAQGYLADRPDTPVVCFRCSAVVVGVGHVDIQNLGNSQQNPNR